MINDLCEMSLNHFLFNLRNMGKSVILYETEKSVLANLSY